MDALRFADRRLVSAVAAGARWIAPLVLAAVAWSAAGNTAPGATGGIITLPLPAAPGPTGVATPPNIGWSLTIDTTWVDACGYRPVRFTAVPTAVSQADHTVTVRLSPRRYFASAPVVTVTQDIEVPAGAANGTATIAVPQHEHWSTFGLDTFVDGKFVKELSMGPAQVGMNQQWGDWTSPHSLCIGTPFALGAVLMAGNANSTIQVGAGPAAIPLTQNRPGGPMIAAGMPSGMGGLATASDLPVRWIDYSGLDVVYLPLAELERLSDEQPQAWQAIRRWTNAGGNLIVINVGAQWDQLAQLERIAAMRAAAATAEAADDSDPVASGWTRPELAERGQSLRGASRNQGQTMYSTPFPDPASQPIVGTPPAVYPFVTRPLGRGLVVAFAGDPQSATTDWNWVFNTIGDHRWLWFKRHGVSLERDNPEFWNFQIPGVGLAPVTEFQVLITLFAIGIGPVNYLLLRRWKKLNLLVITVPACAAAVTLVLVAFALITDGFGVRARVRSRTDIDQRRGEAVCWSRIAYYAGLAPSRGLTFPSDTVVFPLDGETDGNQFRNLKHHRQLEWAGDLSPESTTGQQHLTSGWFASRTPMQLVTVRARASDARLQIAESATRGEPPQVENHLGVRVERLLLIDSRGDYYRTSELGGGESATLEKVDLAEATRMLAGIYEPGKLENAPGGGPSRGGMFSRRYAYMSGNSYDLERPSTRTSRLEMQLTAPLASFEPRSYVALAAASPEVVLGVDSAREAASFHLIVGRW